MNVSSYLHVLDGRLRVKVPETKRSISKALHVEQVIQSLPGVTRVTANPTTGNVLVFFDSAQMTHTDILFALKKADYLRDDASKTSTSTFQFSARMVDTVSHAVARSVTEALMERAILALL
jgi:Heavy metal associated domain 2